MWRHPRYAVCLLVAALQFAAVCQLATASADARTGPVGMVLRCSESRPAVPAVERRMLRALELLREREAGLKVVLPAPLLDDRHVIGKGWPDSFRTSAAANSFAPSLQLRHIRLQI